MKPQTKSKIIFAHLATMFLLVLTSCSEGGGGSGDVGPSFTVNYTTPSEDSKNISPNTSITAWFSSDIDPNGYDTSSAITLLYNGTLIPGNFIQNGPQLVFTPINPLVKGRTYTVVIQSGIRGKDGSVMNGDYRWTFEVEDPLNESFQIVSTTPAANSTGVELTANVSITFDQQLNPTKYANSVLLQLKNTDVPGNISIDYDRLILNPDEDLEAGSVYKVTVRSNLVESLSGLSLTENYVWYFTTSN